MHGHVGNRLSQETNVGETVYTYDSANRLIIAGPVTYTWDANGNLLNDGMTAYTYDHANRLVSATNQQGSASYSYNGLGDRLQETANGVTTTFALDLASGLTQVLQDGARTYLYGLERLAQSGASGSEYFLTDALGSVRRLVDSGGTIVLSKNYQPYGELLSSQGSATTSYGFTGEWTDGYSQFLYLRARWYSPLVGRFTTKDIWRGDPKMPRSYNKWLYAAANPLIFVDPSGYYHSEVHFDLTFARAKEIAKDLSIADYSRIAHLIAGWDYAVDNIVSLMPLGGCNSCHFMPFDRTIQHINEAVESGKPYLFGAALHQLQDYYSHWGEGYHDQTLGHGLHTITWRTQGMLQDFYYGKHTVYMHGFPILDISPYPAHPYGEVLQDVKSRNPQMTIFPGENWKLVDLYLRLDGEEASVSVRYAMCDYFGFQPDEYFEGSRRDTYMTRKTDEYIRRFLERFASEECPDWTEWTDLENHALEVRSLLTK
jgi:RHS repeat-associated protein